MLTPAIILNSSPATCGRGPGAGRRHVDLARIGLGIGDELGNRFGRKRWMDHHDVGLADDAVATGAMSRMKLKLSLS